MGGVLLSATMGSFLANSENAGLLHNPIKQQVVF